MDFGGSVRGVVTNENGDQQANIEVRYWNDDAQVPRGISTSADGSFAFLGLPPGLFKIEVWPDVSTGRVQDESHYCLGPEENKDLGAIMLPSGALVSGYVKDANGEPLQNVDFKCNVAEDIKEWEAEVGTDGYYQRRLPIGSYVIYPDRDDIPGYSALPLHFEVIDLAQDLVLPDIIAYDAVTGSRISGSVSNPDGVEYGETLEVICFLNDQSFELEDMLRATSIAEHEVEVPGVYELFVPPLHN